MGNLGRAGYGASLEGTVCVFINGLPLNFVNQLTLSVALLI